MNTKLLRQKVLDLAIHGKLVPQNPEHEPASKLLERIRGESLPLATAGKSSSAAPSAGSNAARNACSNPISEDEIPFEIPENWCWCRLSDYLDVRDGTHDSPKYFEEGIPFVTSKNLRNGEINFSDCKLISFEDHKKYSARSFVEDGDILFAMIGSIGNPVIVKKDRDFSIKNVALFKRYSKEFTNEKFIYFYLYYAQEIMKKNTTGGLQPFMSLSMLRDWYFPLPPLEEQKLIVEEIERIFALIDTVEQNKTDLETVIKQTKSKILDLAIHGKLVSQDKTDEPASVLFEKIKKEKQLTDVDEIEELPFEIPSSWKWVHLSDVCLKLKRGKSPKYVEKSSYMAFAQKCNQKDGPTSLEKALYIDESSLNRYPPEEYMKKYDTVINSTGTGTLGRVGIYDCDVPEGIKGVFADSHVTTIHPSSYVNPKYVYYFVKSKQRYLESAGEGSTNQKELKVNTICEMEFPLPPIEEQNRIALKIENVFQLINTI